MEPGLVIAERFEIVQAAGAGGMGEVYRALDRQTGRTVAVKRLRDHGERDAERFVHEAIVLAALDHPAIVRYVAHGAEPGGPRWLAMEWIDGESLRARLDRSELSVEQAVDLGIRVASALGEVHRRGLVHRDLKPSNLFLEGCDLARVKLIDFGIARAEGDAPRSGGGVGLGTPGYMAPEQVEGDLDLDARTDVFALGCVLFHALAGQPAFVGESAVALLVRVTSAAAPALRPLAPQVSEALDDLVARMLSRSPADRPWDGAVVAGELTALRDRGALRAGVAGTLHLPRLDPLPISAAPTLVVPRGPLHATPAGEARAPAPRAPATGRPPAPPAFAAGGTQAAAGTGHPGESSERAGRRVLAPGTVLAGKLHVVRLLGAGGMGTVYEIEHSLTRHRRALKLLHAHGREHPTTVERFLREASAAGRIENPHIVETFDAGTLDTGEPYVVMELLVGETIAAKLTRERRFDLGTLSELIGQACDGVQAAHDAGIVHRDLKPENLFVISRDGQPFVKILDFGVSKFDPARTGELGATADGDALGTPLYMPPEQVRGERDLDGRADVYALGVLLYQCASGEPPFRPRSFPHLCLLINEGKPTPLDALRPDLPRAFHLLVARAMATDRERRIQTVRALGEALRAVRAGEPPRTSEPPPGVMHHEGGRRPGSPLRSPPSASFRHETRPPPPEHGPGVMSPEGGGRPGSRPRPPSGSPPSRQEIRAAAQHLADQGQGPAGVMSPGGGRPGSYPRPPSGSAPSRQEIRAASAGPSSARAPASRAEPPGSVELHGEPSSPLDDPPLTRLQALAFAVQVSGAPHETIAQNLAGMPSRIRSRGIFFEGLARVVAAARNEAASADLFLRAGVGARTTPFRYYPHRDFYKIYYLAARMLYPALPFPTALRKTAQSFFPIFRNSLLGKTMSALMGTEPRTILPMLARAYNISVEGNVHEAELTGPAEVTWTGTAEKVEWYIDTFTGIVEGALEPDARAAVRVQVDEKTPAGDVVRYRFKIVW